MTFIASSSKIKLLRILVEPGCTSARLSPNDDQSPAISTRPQKNLCQPGTRLLVDAGNPGLVSWKRLPQYRTRRGNECDVPMAACSVAGAAYPCQTDSCIFEILASIAKELHEIPPGFVLAICTI